MARFLLTSLLWLAAAMPAGAGEPAPLADQPNAAPQTPQMDRALSEARARRAPVLADFRAPWCYSCYYMATHVLTGPSFQQLERGAVIAELDVDSPEGAYWQRKWNVKALPSYVVVDAQGQELGRIIGERTRADFFPAISAILARGTSLAALQKQVKDDSDASVQAAREVLRAYLARDDAGGGLAWHDGLDATVRAALDQDSDSTLLLNRLRLQQAAVAGDAVACVAASQAVLARELGCERPDELETLMQCTASLPPERRRDVLLPQAAPLAKLLNQRVFVPAGRCADERSAVLAAADLYDALGHVKERQQLLGKAIADVERRLGDGFKRDRNLADNLRVYLERADDRGHYDALMPKLIAAYPDDYVYAYRYGKSLAERGRHAQALPYFERAAKLAYGVNRLQVAELHARSLQALGRASEARQVIAAALHANGPWFPDQVEKLKALQQELSK